MLLKWDRFRLCAGDKNKIKNSFSKWDRFRLCAGDKNKIKNSFSKWDRFRLCIGDKNKKNNPFLTWVRFRLSNSSGGAGLTEMLLALAITAAAAPFAYRQISRVSQNMKNVAIARRLIDDGDPIRNYIRLHSADMPENEVVKIETDYDDRKVFASKSKGALSAFVVIKTYKDDVLGANQIAGLMGPDAGVVETDGVAYGSAGGWAVSIDGAGPGDIVHRIDLAGQSDDTAKYLHRTVLSEGELSTMKRDLSMGSKSIGNAGAVDAQKLNATDLGAHLVRTGAIATSALYFTSGLNLNPERSTMRSVRANGDAIGFRNFWTDNFHSPSGALTTDRATIANKLTVSNKFEVKAPYSKTASGFAGASASSVKTAYLDTTNLTFMPGFGLVVSSELLYSSTPPIKLGNWTFPNSSGAGPKFSSIKLKNLDGKEPVSSIPDFSEILKENWQ